MQLGQNHVSIVVVENVLIADPAEPHSKGTQLAHSDSVAVPATGEQPAGLAALRCQAANREQSVGKIEGPAHREAGDFELPCALIIGERTQSTDEKTSLNDTLREFALG